MKAFVGLIGLLLVGAGRPADAQSFSSVPNSVIRGSLRYSATSSRDDGKLGRPARNGDVSVTVTVTNIGREKVRTAVAVCTVRTRGYLRATRTGKPDFIEFGLGSQCASKLPEFSLEAGESRQFASMIPRFRITGGRQSLGPWYLVAEMHLPDTTIDLRAGQITFASPLRGLGFKVKSGVEGIAPASLATHITIYNHRADSAYLELGACSVRILGYTDRTRRAPPTFQSSRRSPPWQPGVGYVCPMYLAFRNVAPSDSISPREFNPSVPVHELLADSLPAGRYYLTTVVELNGRDTTLDAGSVYMTPVEQPPPAQRVVDGMQYSSSIHRAHFGATDSLEWNITVENLSSRARTVLLPTMGNCISISGDPDPKIRDRWYMRRQLSWDTRNCAVAQEELAVAPGAKRILSGRLCAPPNPIHYILSFWTRQKSDGSRQSFVGLPVEER